MKKEQRKDRESRKFLEGEYLCALGKIFGESAIEVTTSYRKPNRGQQISDFPRVVG